MTKQELTEIRKHVYAAKDHVCKSQDVADYRDARGDRELRRRLAKARTWLEAVDRQIDELDRE